jgi:L-threonylcarbamoyladenylate synthase
MTEPRRLDLIRDPEADFTPVVEHLEAGGVISYPTETVYGLGSACVDVGIHRIQELKRRGPDKPLLVLVQSAEAVEGLRWTDDARELAGIFWPGSLTLLLEDPSGIFPCGVRHGETRAVGVRVSPHPTVARLVEALGAPLTSTSLNLPGEPPALGGREAFGVVRRLGGDDVWVLDGGALPPSGPSTVVDCTGPEPIVIREGTVPIGRLRCAIPQTHERSI